MPRYFFRRTPSEKKYSPGASVVAASNDPIITGGGKKREVQGGRRPDHSFASLIRTFPLTPSLSLSHTHTHTCGNKNTHTCRCSEGQSFHHVPNSLNSSVRDDGHTKTAGVLGHLVHRRALGTSAGHHCVGTTRNTTPSVPPRPGSARHRTSRVSVPPFHLFDSLSSPLRLVSYLPG